MLGAGRTDARVSAQGFALQLLISGAPLPSQTGFLREMNRNLPQDIRLLSVREVPVGFNVIRDATQKTYRYYFTFGDKPHPFCAPLLGYFPGQLDIEAMKNGATLFVGEHDFRTFVGSPGKDTRTRRRVADCHLQENKELTASFFPGDSFCLTVVGQGFGRYQVRRMMAALVALGRRSLSEQDLKETLRTGNPIELKEIAPASGLQLIEVQFGTDT